MVENQAGLARLALGQINGILLDNPIKLVKLREAIKPLFAIDWSTRLLVLVGAEKVRILLRRLRGSPLSRNEYIEIHDHLILSVSHPDLPLPEHWTKWHAMIAKYNLFLHADTRRWISTVTRLQTSRITSPIDLTTLNRQEIFPIDDDLEKNGLSILLWQAAKCLFDSPSWNTRPSRWNKIEIDVENILKKFQFKTIEETEFWTERQELATKLGIPGDLDKITPSRTMHWLAMADDNRHLVPEFLRASKQVNTLRSVQGSLRPVASGIRSYVHFCSLVNRQPFPPSENTVQLWSTIFNPGGTFRNYIQHLAKACFLMDMDTFWLTPAVRNLAKGLESSLDTSFRFPNFIFSKDLLKILDHETIDSQFGQLCYLSYLFSLRVPSETLQIRRAYHDDPLTQFVHQEDRALMGIRKYENNELLVLKFARRKNIRGGCVLFRPCICYENHPRAIGLCPIHTVWPIIARNTPPGCVVFSTFSPTSINRTLKCVMTKIGYADGARYSSHAFRRGATQEIKDSGSTLSIIIKSGTWTHSGYRSYLDLQADFAINISRFVLDAADSDSNDEDDSLPKNERKIRKRMKGVPISFTPRE